MLKRLWLVMTFVVIAALVACGPQATPEPTEAPAVEEPAEEEPEEPAEEEPEEPAISELKILWAEWDPADYLQQIGNMYEEETGIKVTVVQEPWGSFQDRFFTEMAAQGDAWDMVVGDSQWLGQGATQGHYLEMTDFLNSTGLADSVTQATLTYYGEYPPASGQYWGFPTEGDADGWAYRKDLFEDPDEMAAFEEEYGRPLAIPTTYDELYEIANFFTRPDDGLYGVAIYSQKDYDAITMGVENTFFSYGARWQDPETFEVEGYVNSDRAVEGLQMYKDLYQCCQAPGLTNAFYNETNDAFISGQVAMSMNYFAFFPALANPGVNPYAEDTGFFPNPGGPYGDRAAALGGQGMHIISYISEERQQAAMDFIEWFGLEEIQAEWAALGGFTCNATVLESDTFLNATPFNPAFAETMTFVMDFWNIPEYAQLLEVTQLELHRCVVADEAEPQETMDRIAEEHREILVDAGYLE